MATSVPIINSAETISSDFEQSINACFTKLYTLFGFWPRVLPPVGGDRTEAQQAHLVAIHESDTMNSDHRIDREGRAAVDIDNQEDFRHANEKLFLDTLAEFGWHNMTNDGAPFPTEGWHFAKHGISTAGENSSPIDNKGDTEMSSGVTFLKQSTLTKTNGRIQHTTVAAVSDLGLRHASNWKEFVCNYIDGGPGDTLSQYAKGLGGNPSIILSDAEWATESKRLTTP